MIHQTMDRGPMNGWRCKLCAWHRRGSSFRLMDIDTLITHGKQQHHLQGENLNEFIHEAIWEERKPESSMLGHGYAPAVQGPQEYPEMPRSLGSMAAEKSQLHRNQQSSQVLPSVEIGVATSWYSATESSRSAPLHSSTIGQVLENFRPGPTTNFSVPFTVYENLSKPKEPSQLSKSTSTSEAGGMSTTPPTFSRVVAGGLHGRTNSIGSRVASTVQYFNSAASMSGSAFDKKLTPQRASSIGYGRSTTGSYIAPTNKSPFPLGGMQQQTQQAAVSTNTCNTTAETSSTPLGGGTSDQGPKRRRAQSQLNKIAMQQLEESEAIVLASKADKTMSAPTIDPLKHITFCAREDIQRLQANIQAAKRERKGFFSNYHRETPRPGTPAYSMTSPLVKFGTPRQSNPTFKRTSYSLNTAITPSGNTPAWIKPLQLGNFAFNNSLSLANDASSSYQQQESNYMSHFTFTTDELLRGANYTGSVNWSNGAENPTLLEKDYSPFMGSESSSGQFPPTPSNVDSVFQFKGEAATSANTPEKQSVAASVEAPTYSSGIEDLLPEVEMRENSVNDHGQRTN